MADVKLSTVINDEVLYHWGGRDIMRKVIVITSCLPRDVDFIMQKTLTVSLLLLIFDVLYFLPYLLMQLASHGALLAYFTQAAADKCVSVEFLLFEQKSAHLCNIKENIKNFVTCISELDNCSFQAYLPGLLLPSPLYLGV